MAGSTAASQSEPMLENSLPLIATDLEDDSRLELFILDVGLNLGDDWVGDVVFVVFEEALQELARVL